MIEQARGVRNIRDARLGEFGADLQSPLWEFTNGPSQTSRCAACWSCVIASLTRADSMR